MNADRKEEMAYIVVFIVGLLHLYMALILSIIKGDGKIEFSTPLLATLLLGAMASGASLLLFFLKKRGFSAMTKLGILDPTDDLEEGYGKCGKCSSRIPVSAARCPKCGARFRYDREDVMFLLIFVVGFAILYWTLISDFLLGREVGSFDSGEKTMILVAMAVSTIGLVPFAFKRAGFSVAATVVSGEGGVGVPGRGGVSQMEIVSGQMNINVQPGAEGAFGAGGGMPGTITPQQVVISGGLMRGGDIGIPQLDPSDPNAVKQFQIESKMRELELKQRMDEETRGLRDKLDMEMKKKDRFRQMLAEARLEGMEMRSQVEDAVKRSVPTLQAQAAAPAARPQGQTTGRMETSVQAASSRTKRMLFPFTSIVGQETMLKALLLNAVDPNVGGVLIRGQKGTGKSVGVRGLCEILPEIEVVKGCRFSCDPKEPDKFCWECEEKMKEGKIEIETRPIRVVDLPLNTTEDRLVGSIDLERILTEGVMSFEPGIMAEAHRGLLYVDEINLLDDYVVDVLLDSAAMGINTVEREGVSVSHPSRFIIVGSMNPEEGELRPQLLDRIALQVEVTGIQDIKKRIEIMHRREQFDKDATAFREQFEPQQREHRDKLIQARDLLDKVVTPQRILVIIARISVDFNVDGHRADIIIERTARANAAFEGRTEVTVEDVIMAAEMALPHRMRKKPFEEEVFSSELLRHVVKKYGV